MDPERRFSAKGELMRALFMLLLATAPAWSQFTPASNLACAQAHCDSQMTDQAKLAPPLVITNTSYDPTGGANIGLGCSTNNTIFACTFQTTPSLIVYDATGVRICTSGAELDGQAYHSAPAIDAGGKVVVGDSNHIAMFDSANVSGGVCAVVWRSAVLNGSPVSPVFDPGLNLVLGATTTGWVYAISTVDGHTVASKSMTNAGLTYLTTNTPCVQNGRIFIVTQRSNVQSDGRIFGLATADLSTVAGFPVATTGPSYASPVCYNGWVITDDATPAAIWISQTDGTPASWSPVSLPARAIASFALDLRSPASIWIALNGTGFLRRQQVSNGATLGTLALYDVNGVGSVAASALTLAGSTDSPYLIMGLAGGGKTSTTMFDLSTKLAAWTVYTESGANGQFPVLNRSNRHTVAFTTKTGGAYFAQGSSASARIGLRTTLKGRVVVR
jgi:hypothetical protein